MGVARGASATVTVLPLLSTQLFGIAAFDLPTMASVPLLLLIVALVACIVPARRAMAIDPVNALRS